jgi:oxalate decarboxylase/phosphoglucose isomerase-like protein (cupin superfamily)
MADRLEVHVLADEGDERGRAWQLGAAGTGFLRAVEDVHVMTLEPGFVRGNHFHQEKREILIVEHDGEWALYWDDGPAEAPQERVFERAGAVTVLVPPGSAHAIENRGGGTMRLVSISDRPYTPAAPDAHRRVLKKVE